MQTICTVISCPFSIINDTSNRLINCILNSLNCKVDSIAAKLFKALVFVAVTTILGTTLTVALISGIGGTALITPLLISEIALCMTLFSCLIYKKIQIENSSAQASTDKRNLSSSWSSGSLLGSNTSELERSESYGEFNPGVNPNKFRPIISQEDVIINFKSSIYHSLDQIENKLKELNFEGLERIAYDFESNMYNLKFNTQEQVANFHTTLILFNPIYSSITFKSNEIKISENHLQYFLENYIPTEFTINPTYN